MSFNKNLIKTDVILKKYKRLKLYLLLKNNYYKLILKYWFIIINKNKLKIEVSNNILKVLNKIYMKVKFDICNFI